jgi:hypothetical protein
MVRHLWPIQGQDLNGAFAPGVKTPGYHLLPFHGKDDKSTFSRTQLGVISTEARNERSGEILWMEIERQDVSTPLDMTQPTTSCSQSRRLSALY